MKRAAPFALVAAGAALLLWNLGRPALWQDEAETALRAESILETGLPRMTLHGVWVTAQPSLTTHEGNAEGVWTWNTWLPAYLAAVSIAALGSTALAARLPFALAGLLTLWLAWRLFTDGEKDAGRGRRPWAAEAALGLLAFSPSFLLFARQSRYYALVALGTVLVLRSWRRLLAGKSWGVAAVVLSFQLLLHSSFAFFAAAGLTLALDAALRGRECLRSRRVWTAAGLTLLLASPAAWYFRVWDRPGNHAYGFVESLQFLKTFLLWMSVFTVPLALVAAAHAARWRLVAGAFALLCGLVAEGPLSLACATLVWTALLVVAARAPAPRGVMNLERMALLSIVATLALLSFSAAEPYGRYLAGLLPCCAYLVARSLSSLGRGRPAAVAALAALAVSCNLSSLVPLKIAQALAAPVSPEPSVSGAMRQRARDLKPRSELAVFAAELWRGPAGYVEEVSALMQRMGGRTFFADADQLSLLYASGLRPVYPDEFMTLRPDWLLPSPWISLSPALEARMRALLASGRYALVPMLAPNLAWQNNPDPLLRNFAPHRAPLALYRRRP